VLFKHPFIHTLKYLQGNARACVFTEPLWGIPYNLYAPYVSVYMLSLGMNDHQIGLLASVSLVMQFVYALLSGAITDRLGRRKTAFLFDLFAWSIPCLIWAVAQNFTYFLVAVIFNSMWRITSNAWTCLMVEDTDQKLLVDIYSWIYIAGLLAAFFTPLAGLLINRFTLVPAMRGLYLFAFVGMTVKFIVTYITTKETTRGLIRMEETRAQSIWSMLGGYGAVLGRILASPKTLYTIGIMLVLSIFNTINNAFWPVIVTERLRIPAGELSIYPFTRSIVMLVFFFVVMPRLRERHFRMPMILGFLSLIASQAVVILLPPQHPFLLLIAPLLEAFGIPTVSTLLDRMTIVNVAEEERARILSLMYVVVITLTSPFGWIAGSLSTINRILPFLINMGILMLGAVLAYRAGRQKIMKHKTA